MTSASPAVPAELAAFLAARRPALNRVLARARHAHPGVRPQALLDAVASWLSPFTISKDHTPAASSALLEGLFALVVDHCARGTLARMAGVRELLGTALHDPALRALAEQDPQRLPADLAQASIRVAPHDAGFIRSLTAAARHAPDADALRQAGAVVAWRLGEPRLRRAALSTLATMPAPLALSAMAMADWPEAAWPFALAALRRDAWTHPRAAVSLDLLDALAEGQPGVDIAGAAARVGTALPAPFERWQARPAVGDFIGFGGHFPRPPVLLALAGRHTLFVEVDSATWRVEADLFGHRCQPVPLEAVPGLGGQAQEAPLPAALAAELPRLERSARAAGATAVRVCEGLVALTMARSHRVQLRVPPTERA